MKKQDTKMLAILAIGGALAYAISKEGSPLELPTGEGGGILMQSQGKTMPSGQFNRVLDDIVTINGKIVITIEGLGEQDQRTGYIYGTPKIGIINPTATNAELKLVVSQVKNALRNPTIFTPTQRGILTSLETKAQGGLSSVNGYFSLDGTF